MGARGSAVLKLTLGSSHPVIQRQAELTAAAESRRRAALAPQGCLGSPPSVCFGVPEHAAPLPPPSQVVTQWADSLGLRAGQAKQGHRLELLSGRPKLWQSWAGKGPGPAVKVPAICTRGPGFRGLPMRTLPCQPPGPHKETGPRDHPQPQTQDEAAGGRLPLSSLCSRALTALTHLNPCPQHIQSLCSQMLKPRCTDSQVATKP